MDKVLHKKLKNKNRDAQRELYNTYNHIWYSVCLRYTSNNHDASDILQNALVKIYTKINQFDSQKGNFKSWSCKIIVNECLMFFRAKSNRFKAQDIEEAKSVFDLGETPIERLSALELIKLIRTLPNGYQMVFNLYVLEGYNHNEISEMLGISIGTSKSQLFKARKLLKQKIEVLI